MKQFLDIIVKLAKHWIQLDHILLVTLLILVLWQLFKWWVYYRRGVILKLNFRFLKTNIGLILDLTGNRQVLIDFIEDIKAQKTQCALLNGKYPILRQVYQCISETKLHIQETEMVKLSKTRLKKSMTMQLFSTHVNTVIKQLLNPTAYHVVISHNKRNYLYPLNDDLLKLFYGNHTFQIVLIIEHMNNLLNDENFNSDEDKIRSILKITKTSNAMFIRDIMQRLNSDEFLQLNDEIITKIESNELEVVK